jgi:hypothetical protein
MAVKELVTMSAQEIDRSDLIRRILERRLTQVKAVEILGINVRQVFRMCRAFERDGLAGLASKKRGRPSNRRLKPDLEARAVALVRERYHDFGPELAHEKLLELHDIRVGRETLRHWRVDAGVWMPRNASPTLSALPARSAGIEKVVFESGVDSVSEPRSLRPTSIGRTGARKVNRAPDAKPLSPDDEGPDQPSKSKDDDGQKCEPVRPLEVRKQADGPFCAAMMGNLVLHGALYNDGLSQAQIEPPRRV